MSAWGILSKIFKLPSTTIQIRHLSFNMEFDVVTNESHKWEATTTSNPVETGSQISDHIQVLPDKLDMTGIISNSSLIWMKDNLLTLGKAVGLYDGESEVQKAFDLLRKLLENRQAVTVYTRYRTYPSMVLTSLSIPRSIENGDAIEFTASFTHIKQVATLIVDASDAGINSDSTSSEDVGRRTESTSNTGNKNCSGTSTETKITVNNQVNIGNKQTNNINVN